MISLKVYMPICILFSIKTIKCSLVIDEESQTGLYVHDYCPKMEYCEEGTHVMCMYYNPDRKMGPQCYNSPNISVTPDLAQKLLDISNAIRSRIALGKEKGKDGQLPRGYGIFRLKWDNELATFAQVLSNQCILRHDICRATKRFSDPGQNIGLVRFTYPDWFLMNSNKFLEPGINEQKVLYALTAVFKFWFSEKKYVSTNMISDYPDWTKNPEEQKGRLYMDMIHGPATHMGCGVSGYSTYTFSDNNADVNHNSIQVVCNFSAKPPSHGVIYNITPPTEVGYTVRCGCPPGYDEDQDCLCNENLTYSATVAAPHRTICSHTGFNQKPPVVILPIFTIENAQDHQILPRFNNQSLRRAMPLNENNSMELFKFVDSMTANRYLEKYNTKSTIPYVKHNIQPVNQRRIGNAHKGTQIRSHEKHEKKLKLYEIRKRHFGNSKFEYKARTPKATTGYRRSLEKSLLKHPSIFSRSARFELPYIRNITVIKKDVSPRKDFSSVKRLVADYLVKRKGYGSFVNTDNIKQNIFNISPKYTSNISITEKYKFTRSVSGNKNEPHEQKIFELKSYTKVIDSKLINLLNNLEQEVKHIQLNKIEKDIFDAKIRKIYSSIRSNRLQKNRQKDDFHLDSTDNIGAVSYNNNEYMTAETISNDAYLENDKLEREHRRTGDEPPSGYESLKRYKIHNYKDEGSLKNQENIFKTKYVYRHNKINKNDFDDNSINNHARSIKDVRENVLITDIDRIKNYYPKNDAEDPLGYEKRKYYQDKLDTIQRKLHNSRSHRHRNENEISRHLRPVQNSKDDIKLKTKTGRTNLSSRSRNQDNTFFMPNRARFLHGF